MLSPYPSCQRWCIEVLKWQKLSRNFDAQFKMHSRVSDQCDLECCTFKQCYSQRLAPSLRHFLIDVNGWGINTSTSVAHHQPGLFSAVNRLWSRSFTTCNHHIHCAGSQEIRDAVCETPHADYRTREDECISGYEYVHQGTLHAIPVRLQHADTQTTEQQDKVFEWHATRHMPPWSRGLWGASIVTKLIVCAVLTVSENTLTILTGQWRGVSQLPDWLYVERYQVYQCQCKHQSLPTSQLCFSIAIIRKSSETRMWRLMLYISCF